MRHLYIHIPFCRRRCSYCDFAIAVRKRVPGECFVDRIASEYRLRCNHRDAVAGPLETLYLGGGTPSLLSTKQVAELVASVTVRPGFGDAQPEITLEANPEDVTPVVAEEWMAAGITRVSLGLQSLDDGVLKWMHRTHTAAQGLESLDVLRRSGVPSISVDVIFGLPTPLSGDVCQALERLLDFEPDHISAYGLTAEKRTPLHRWIGRGETSLPPEGLYAEEFLRVHELLTTRGFEHYEVSNYARPGHRSRHNQAYWSGVDYLGLGPSAHSFIGGERRWNLSAWSAYEQAVARNLDPVEEGERPGPELRCLERLYLGLRTADGASLHDCGPLNHRFLQEVVGAGWVTELGDRVRLTPEGWLRLDQIVTALTTSVEGG